MQAQDVMSTNIVSVAPDRPVEEVAALMLERHISGVPVVDADGRLVGIIGEGSFLPMIEGESAERRSWWQSLVGTREEQAYDYLRAHGRVARDIMTAPAASVAPTTPVAEIARLLETRQLRRVAVVEEGRVVGIVSRADMLRALASHRPATPVSTDDRGLRQRIEERFRQAGLDWSHDLNVVVSDGRAHLWGFVVTEEEAGAYQRLAEEVAGEGRVESHLTVRDTASHLRPGGRYGLA